MEYDKRSRKTDGRPIPSRSHLRLGSSSPIDCNIPQWMAVKKEEIIRKWWSSIATRGCICYCYHYYYYSYYYILLYIYIYISSYIIYIYIHYEVSHGFPCFHPWNQKLASRLKPWILNFRPVQWDHQYVYLLGGFNLPLCLINILLMMVKIKK